MTKYKKEFEKRENQRGPYQLTGRYSVYCDCGEKKTNNAISCKRCNFLDGVKTQADIISVMRQHGGIIYQSQLYRELGIDYRQLNKIINVLRKKGRIKSRLDTNLNQIILYE